MMFSSSIVGHDADDAARLVADADELHDAVGPAQLAVERVLAGEERLREALADDDDALGAVLVGVAEVAAFEDRQPHGSEEVRARRSGTWRGDRPGRSCAWRPAAAKAKLMLESLIVAPGNAEAGRRRVRLRGGLRPGAVHVAIEVTHLLGRSSIGHDGQIDGENVGGVEGRAGVLEHEESAHEHAGSGEEQEGGGDLRDGEDAKAAAASAGDAHFGR